MLDVPKLTLVGTASKVANAADLANLKDRVVALETSVSGALTSIAGLLNTDTSLDARITALETQLSSDLVDQSVGDQLPADAAAVIRLA